MTSLDRLIASPFDGKRLLVKVDVDGAECKAIRSAQLLLTISPPLTWVVEVCLRDYHPKGLNADFQRTFEMFERSGYAAYAIGGALTAVLGEDVVPWVNDPSTWPSGINHLFRHVESGQAPTNMKFV